ncbi:unnamed protein product [Chrysodeixis includens]|uniref:Uncharacterized protein n=1 Tax=Chrysodeixis includens TaxID=689277 RepID=A0A9N8Q0C7_CHRIL|nr:unnamed protein product [Chrysodeixis includens]
MHSVLYSDKPKAAESARPPQSIANCRSDIPKASQPVARYRNVHLCGAWQWQDTVVCVLHGTALFPRIAPVFLVEARDVGLWFSLDSAEADRIDFSS